MPAFIDITGQKYNRLTVVNRVANHGDKTTWLCKCDCGNFCSVYGQYLKSGKTKSCGCYQKEQARANRLSHGRADKKSSEYKEYTRETHIMRKYKLSIDRYNAMLTEQNNKCFICGYAFGKKQGDIYVDHCHETKQVRGLLCQNCNTGLGNFKDNTEALQKAIEYLKRT